MRLGQRRGKRLGWLISIPLAITAALVSSSLAFAVPSAPPDPPEPESVAGCDWYGELSESIDMRYTHPGEQQTQTRTIRKKFSSMAADSPGCAAFYSETYYDNFLDLGEDYCYPDQSTWYLGSTYYNVLLEGTGYGVGALTGLVNSDGAGTSAYVFGSGASYEITSTTDAMNPCGETSGGTVTLASAGVHSELTTDCGTERAVPNMQVQAFAGTCQRESVENHGAGNTTTTTTTWTWRFRKAVCDPQVDTDGGGVSDCQEYLAQTNPFDASDDVRQPDSDGDGVHDGIDQCPGTPAGDRVNEFGCTLDEDSDGVHDGTDQCPGTPTGTPVNSAGCTLDTDGDGVHDGTDQCPGTPTGTPVNSAGCTLDTDGDGVHDGTDQCPGTPAGTPVDASGCPQNRPPIAGDDAASTTPGVSVDVNVLANDSDPDGDAISVESCTAGSFGTVQVVGGYARYTPAAGFSGTDSFSCTIVDGAGGSDSAVVSVTVAEVELLLHRSIDYQAAWFDNKVAPFVKNYGADLLILRGISSAWVTGDATSLSMVRQVCVRPIFQVMVTSSSDVPVLWNDGSQDLNGQNGIFWNTPATPIAGGFGSELTSKSSVCSHVSGTSITWSPEALRADANVLQLNYNIASVKHTLEVTVYFVDGRSASNTIYDAEKAPKKTPNITRMENTPKPIKIRL